MTPRIHTQDVDFTLWHGDALETLRGMEDGSVDCCVTSPPYWGLRDYGTGSWDGGDPECDHQAPPGKSSGQRATRTFTLGEIYREECGRCGATRVDLQLGLEGTPDEYVARMVGVFREVRRCLTDAGTLWLNLGDSYGSGTLGRNDADRLDAGLAGGHGGGTTAPRMGTHQAGAAWGKPEDLVGIPWRVAFALQADGWYLRSDIIWSKPNPMPESVTDRPTKAHEYVFLLSKSPRYWFDQDAVREPYHFDGRKITTVQGGAGSVQHRNGERWPKRGKIWDERKEMGFSGDTKHPTTDAIEAGMAIPSFATPGGGRNIRSVWEIATQPYPDAHFAVFPEELPRRCILAGCPEWVCGTCGKARERVVERTAMVIDRSARTYERGQTRSSGTMLEPATSTTTGWSDCGHDNYRPGTVLDPFGGSGTTALVARRHGRRSVLIELSETYCDLAAKRLQQLSLLSEFS